MNKCIEKTTQRKTKNAADVHQEEWKPIAGFPYEINREGTVRRLYHGKWKTIHPFYDRGKMRIHLYSNGKKSAFPIARLVAMTFLDNEANEPCAIHIHSPRLDDSVTNIKWAKYSKYHGLTNTGFRYISRRTRSDKNRPYTVFRVMIRDNDGNRIEKDRAALEDAITIRNKLLLEYGRDIPD